jgi:uncharacterized delta-60 repeat protein
MKLKILLIIFFIQSLNCIVYSQVTEQWVQRYNGPLNGEDIPSSMKVDNSGNVYVTGSTPGMGAAKDYATVKYNTSGALQWEQRYNGTGNGPDYASAIAVDNSGNVIVTGYSMGNGTNFDYVTIKYSSLGILMWVKRYNAPGNGEDRANSVTTDDAGNIYVTGNCQVNGSDYDCVTIKYNPAGTVQWTQAYNALPNRFDVGWSIELDLSGSIYVGGWSSAFVNNVLDCDVIIIKYTPSSQQQWTGTIDGTGSTIFYFAGFDVDDLGNTYIGCTRVAAGNYDYATVKYNTTGAHLWVKIYNGPGNGYDRATSIKESGGNVYVTGYSMGIGTNYDYATIKYNSFGTMQWIQRYNGPVNDSDYAWSLAADGTGVYVTGGTDNGNVQFYDYSTIKYSHSGILQWTQGYNGPANSIDVSSCIGLDTSGNVYITGKSYGLNAAGYDYATIKYSSGADKLILNNAPPEFKLNDNFPNPFNPTTNIEFIIPSSSLVKLAVYDMLGREVQTLVNGQLNAGTHNAQWNASSYPSGVFFYRITAGNFTETKKMILVK